MTSSSSHNPNDPNNHNGNSNSLDNYNDVGDHNIPNMSSKAQESGKLGDMYRQNLAATWMMQPGELAPDRCVEDIFAGGDGWAANASTNTTSATVTQVSNVRGDDEDSGGGGSWSRSHHHHQRNSSGSTLKPYSTKGQMPAHSGTGQSGVSGRTSIEQQVHASHDAKRARQIKGNEVNELEEREDLRSWFISAQ